MSERERATDSAGYGVRGERGAGVVDDVLVHANGILRTLAAELAQEPLLFHFPAARLAVLHHRDLQHFSLRRNADNEGDVLVLADFIQDDSVAVCRILCLSDEC